MIQRFIKAWLASLRKPNLRSHESPNCSVFRSILLFIFVENNRIDCCTVWIKLQYLWYVTLNPYEKSKWSIASPTHYSLFFKQKYSSSFSGNNRQSGTALTTDNICCSGNDFQVSSLNFMRLYFCGGDWKVPFEGERSIRQPFIVLKSFDCYWIFVYYLLDCERYLCLLHICSLDIPILVGHIVLSK